MTGRRTAMLWVVAWLIVVALATALVWVVISRAGNEVVSSPVPVPTGDSSATRSPTQEGGSPGSRPTRTPSATADASPTGTVTPTPQPTGAVPEVQRRTWEGVAGRVVVQCEGQAIGLGGAQPAAGYAVEVDDRGPDRVEVEFEAGDDSDRRVRVRASCGGGVPTFEVDD